MFLDVNGQHLQVTLKRFDSSCNKDFRGRVITSWGDPRIQSPPMVTIGLSIHRMEQKQSDYNHRFSTKRWELFKCSSPSQFTLFAMEKIWISRNCRTHFLIVWVATSYMQINLSPAFEWQVENEMASPQFLLLFCVLIQCSGKANKYLRALFDGKSPD